METIAAVLLISISSPLVVMVAMVLFLALSSVAVIK